MMSTTDQASKSIVPVFENLPDCFSLKEKRNEASGCETWDVFDRSKKKKLVLKRFAKSAYSDAGVFERFKQDLTILETIRPKENGWPCTIAVGQSEEGIWYLREPVVGKSLFETVSQGKIFKEFDAARRFLSLTGLLIQLHQGGLLHRNLKPTNLFCTGVEDALFVDPDVGHFRDPSVFKESYDPSILGSPAFLAPEQRPESTVSGPLDAQTDLWGLAACLAFALTGKRPDILHEDEIPPGFRDLIQSALKIDPAERMDGLARFQIELERIARLTRPSAFGSPEQSQTEPAQTESRQSEPAAQARPTAPDNPLSAALPPGTACPQCRMPVRSASDRVCSQCGRAYFEPCLNCQSMNPFWTRTCRGCNSDLQTLKQRMFATLNTQKQQILKLRETYGHDKTLPLLKYMSTVNHPDFIAFREWAKSMTALVHKERKEIRTYVDNIRSQANVAMDAQKYDKVRQILEQIPRPLLDEEFRKQYTEAGDALTEVDSLIREIRNAIATKQYSPLLSCVQRYLELKANDPEARNLQLKIEKLTTITSVKGMKLRRIPSGRFYMGSHDTDEFLRNNEHPQHRVQITRSLFVGVYPVTQAEFGEIMEYNPSVATEGERCPVESVSWYSALEFCNKMCELEGFLPYYELSKVKRRANGSIETASVSVLGGDGYRLPSEAEWEYVCRAGSITPWCYGDQVMEVGEYAWYFDNAMMETHPVGEKKPNSWGLYDMHGNVMEWCDDWYGEFYYQQCQDEEENPTGPPEGTSKVLRGGAWQFGAEATRSAYRNSSSPEAVSSVIGFRVCRNATDDAMQ